MDQPKRSLWITKCLGTANQQAPVSADTLAKIHASLNTDMTLRQMSAGELSKLSKLLLPIFPRNAAEEEE